MNTGPLASIAHIMKDRGRPPAEIYGTLLGLFLGTPYVWGGSSILGTDCSGCVSTCLSHALGHPLRTTADGLYREHFTRNAGRVEELEGKIGAAFFLDKTGRAVHVAGYMGTGLFANASSIERDRRTMPRRLDELLSMYSDFVPRLRTLEGKTGREADR
ncbi:MAG: C40 family peptidase [Treponema sp.]|nr:C40 family peptidase [Treponema sp.]